MEEQPETNTQVEQSSSSPQPVSLADKFPKFGFKSLYLVALFAVGVLAIGVLTGWFVSGNKTTGKLLGIETQMVPGAKSGTKEAGLADESTFKDSAEGTLEEGGISGEGTHHLVRPGGASQNVYLTSTVIDMQSFVGKKVKVWGQTISARKAGWLMDVGKIKLVE